MADKIEATPANIRIPFADESLGIRLLPTVLSVIAGSTDVISFLGLGGLFTAHITGNLVILAAHVVTGGEAQLAAMMSVPIFVAMLGVTSFLGGKLEASGYTSLQPFLLLQFVLLAGFLALCVTAVRPLDPNTATAIVAGMLGVSAMAVQNALVQVSLKGAPSTAVMTTNVTRFTVDLGEMLVARNPDSVVKARNRAMQTWPAIIGFAVGGGFGAECEVVIGLWALALPASLALLAYAMAPRAGSKMEGQDDTG